jgi:hypothetical protein
MDRAFDLDPQLRSRAGDANYAELINAASPWYMKGAFAMLTAFDRWTAAIGFMAVYKANIEGGAGRARAVSEAQRAVAMTQNAVHPKDKPRLWKDAQGIAFLRAAMVFTGDAAKKLNIAGYDLIQAARRPWTNRGKILRIAYALAFEAILMKFIREGFPGGDEDWPEWLADAFASDALNMIPLAGGEAADFYDRAIRGKYRDAPRSILFSPVYEAYKAYEALLDGENEKSLSHAATFYGQALSGLTGYPLPVVAIKRAFRGAKALGEGDVAGALGAQLGHYTPGPKMKRRRRRR